MTFFFMFCLKVNESIFKKGGVKFLFILILKVLEFFNKIFIDKINFM